MIMPGTQLPARGPGRIHGGKSLAGAHQHPTGTFSRGAPPGAPGIPAGRGWAVGLPWLGAPAEPAPPLGESGAGADELPGARALALPAAAAMPWPRCRPAGTRRSAPGRCWLRLVVCGRGGAGWLGSAGHRPRSSSWRAGAAGWANRGSQALLPAWGLGRTPSRGRSVRLEGRQGWFPPAEGLHGGAWGAGGEAALF